MKLITSVIAVSLLASTANAYVYTYPEAISLNLNNGELGEVNQDVLPGPDAPQAIGGIASMVSIANSEGGSVAFWNAGLVEGPGSSFAPAVAIESYGPLHTPNAAALMPGDTVGPSNTWVDFAYVGGYYDPEIEVGDPAFRSPQGAYVGIEFPDTNNQIHYGWLLMRYDQPAGTYFGTIELMEAAYETDPGVAITIAPEPAAATLATVAIFGAGIRMRRRVGT